MEQFVTPNSFVIYMQVMVQNVKVTLSRTSLVTVLVIAPLFKKFGTRDFLAFFQESLKSKNILSTFFYDSLVVGLGICLGDCLGIRLSIGVFLGELLVFALGFFIF